MQYVQGLVWVYFPGERSFFYLFIWHILFLLSVLGSPWRCSTLLHFLHQDSLLAGLRRLYEMQGIKLGLLRARTP